MAIPWKAVAAFIISFCGAMLAFLQDKTSLDSMTGIQWVIAVLTAVVTAGGVYILPK